MTYRSAFNGLGTADEWCRRLGISVTSDQQRAMRYLDRLGQRFCVEFGFENAVEKAREHWNARRRQRYAKGRR